MGHPSLLSHEVLMDMEDAVPNVRDGVKFSSRAPNAGTYTMDIVRWMDMGHPRQVRVTVTPVPKPQPREVVEQVRQEALAWFAAHDQRPETD